MSNRVNPAKNEPIQWTGEWRVSRFKLFPNPNASIDQYGFCFPTLAGASGRRTMSDQKPASPIWLNSIICAQNAPLLSRSGRSHDLTRAGFSGATSEHFSNPGASGRITHTFSPAALQTRAQAKGKELFNDLPLRTYGCIGARPTTPGILHREVERSGPGFVPRCRVGASSQEKSHRGSAPRSDSAVQGSSAVLVLQMDVGTIGEKLPDSFDLPFCIPCRASDETVGCVMQWAASAVILGGVWIGASRQQ